MKNNSLRPHVNFTVIKRSYLRVVLSTGSPASGSSLDFEFIRECMKINKIRPKFHFLTQKSDSNDSPCVFVFSIYSFFPFRAIWKPFNRLFSTQNRKFLFFVKKWNLGRFFSYILLLIQNLLDEQLPQSLGHLCCRQRLIHNDCISFFKLLEIFTRS